jgi:hypothetical protein
MSDDNIERLTEEEKEKLICGDEELIVQVRICNHCTKRLLNEFEKDPDFFHKFSSSYTRYMINKGELLTFKDLKDLVEKK